MRIKLDTKIKWNKIPVEEIEKWIKLKKQKLKLI
jgi:hypothetical protein